MINQKPDTIFFRSEKNRISFSRLSGLTCEVIESECLQRSLLAQTLIQENKLSRTKKTKRSKEELSLKFLLTEQFLHYKNYYFQCVRTIE